jgi:beta-mannosidase
MQNLYRLNISLYSDIEIADTLEINVGLRKISLEMDEDTPRVLVNGVPMLVMGGEYMVEDIILPRLTEEKTWALLEKAKMSNFNSIFIHGSGCYPENYFYNACDELGLLVLAELPIDEREGADSPEFKDEIKAEILENLTAIDHHPSFGIVIGNGRVAALFDSKEEEERFAAEFTDVESKGIFDAKGECKSHIVRVGHTSLPTYESIVKFAEPKNRNIGSPFFEAHGADIATVTAMLADSLENYPYPNGMNEAAYITGLCSAQLSKAEVEAARRERKKPFGILMSRMNDSWPSLSPSAVDYYGGKKPLHYYERDFFSPVKVSAIPNGTRIKFIVSNDMRIDYSGVFAYQIMNNRNQPVFRDSFPIKVRQTSNLEVYNPDIGSVIKGHEHEYYLLYSVSDRCNDVSEGLLLFTNMKRFSFIEPDCSVVISGNGMEFNVSVSSSVFVRGVELDFGDPNVTLDRNYFDITSKAPVRVRLTTKRMTTVEKLKRELKLRTAYDLGKDC